MKRRETTEPLTNIGRLSQMLTDLGLPTSTKREILRPLGDTRYPERDKIAARIIPEVLAKYGNPKNTSEEEGANL